MNLNVSCKGTTLWSFTEHMVSIVEDPDKYHKQILPFFLQKNSHFQEFSISLKDHALGNIVVLVSLVLFYSHRH